MWNLKLKQNLSLILAATVFFTANVYADSSISIEGSATINKASQSGTINPWNQAKIIGTGESGIQLYTSDFVYDLPLSSPLYRLSDAYCDRMIQKEVEGKPLWGIERNVGVEILDGSEDWKLLKKNSFQNENVTVFTGKNKVSPSLFNGLCTHFEMMDYESQRTNKFDGISYGQSTDELIIKVHKVRNINTVDELKTYLYGQKEAGNPVKLFYPLDQPVFEPFDQKTQEFLSKYENNIIGFKGDNLKSLKEYSMEKSIDDSIFYHTNGTGNETVDYFLSAIEKLEIFNASGKKDFYIEGFYPRKDYLEIKALSSDGTVYTGKIPYSTSDFMKDKLTEVSLKNETEGTIRMQVNLSKIFVPVKSIQGFTYEETGIQNACLKEKEAILPLEIPVFEGNSLDFTNCISGANIDVNDTIEVKDEFGNTISENGRVAVDFSEEKKVSIYLNQRFMGETVIIPIKRDIDLLNGKTVLFLGDSLINEQQYPDAFVQISEGKIRTIGTRGNDLSRHEGRGGWSAYDYCNSNGKYGFDNPFLNEKGVFDFSYYMSQQKFDTLDYVVINLGINDLNLTGHNDINEILRYFNEIVTSIHDYNRDIKVILNTPTMLYAEGDTNTARDLRLDFVRKLNDEYGNNEENLFISPSYLAIDSDKDFKLAMKPLNEDNQSPILYPSDTTHPNPSGYKHLAEATLASMIEILQ